MVANEAQVRLENIDPMLIKSGWKDRIKVEYVITAGRITPIGKSGTRNRPLKADYVLCLANNFNIAVIEAKASYKEPGDGMQQAQQYAKMLDVKFAYSTNGNKIIEYDFITNHQTEVDKFPSPNELLGRLQKILKMSENKMKVLLAPFDRQIKDRKGKPMEPRYYQEIAINGTTSAILAGKKRILLTMATGTGKTFVAFQIAHKLWSSRSPRPKILFLVDRKILLEQAYNESFAAFGDARHKIQRKVNTAYDMYFALYQALDVDDKEMQLYKQYSQDFFDYVIIDECHRGISHDGSAWKNILDYFHMAIHIGMTATPKRDDDNKDTYDYFGLPVYEYSLKQGIEDGFLAPYIIHQVHLDIDHDGYTPSPNEVDLDGKMLEKKTYKVKDFDRTLKIDGRRKTVAAHLINFLQKYDAEYDKTIVFCQTSEHALAMTQQIRNFSCKEHEYAVRIVSDEGDIGREYLDQFKNADKTLPVIAVTSKLLSTGIDIPTCKIIVLDKGINSITEFKQIIGRKIIVLDKGINSITEFKQIIGRGTRVSEQNDKMWFTIIDYRGATRLFNDPDWDGPAEKIIEEEQQIITNEKEQRLKNKIKENNDKPKQDKPEAVKKEVYHIGNINVEIQGKTVMIIDPTKNVNKLTSYQDYTKEQVRKIVNDDETQLYKIWIEPEKRKHFAPLQNVYVFLVLSKSYIVGFRHHLQFFLLVL